MHYYSAWVELGAKVFVDQDEMNEKLLAKHPDRFKWDEEECEFIDETTEDEKTEAFEEIVSEKIWAHFRSDEPMKLSDFKIDMTTFHS